MGAAEVLGVDGTVGVADLVADREASLADMVRAEAGAAGEPVGPGVVGTA